MLELWGHRRNYDWGSRTAIPELIGETAGSAPLAELWFGTHASGSATSVAGLSLRQLVAEDPDRLLGADINALFDGELPFLLKLIAPARPLSLQVHPDLAQARAGFEAENLAGIDLDAPSRLYRDPNHKPELVLAIAPFEALCGFRTPRRALKILSGLPGPLAARMRSELASPSPLEGMLNAFAAALGSPPEHVEEFVAACADRYPDLSPSPRIDRIVSALAYAYPGDPGAAAAVLLNPVTLAPGETLFVPAGGVHVYLSGLAVEIMANSDNVLRAGLTSKHIDIDGLLGIVDPVAAPPSRVAPESHGAQQIYYAPVDDFELSVIEVPDSREVLVLGTGPRIVLGLEGAVTVSGSQRLLLPPGRALFVGADEPAISVRGPGRLVQAGVP